MGDSDLDKGLFSWMERGHLLGVQTQGAKMRWRECKEDWRIVRRTAPGGVGLDWPRNPKTHRMAWGWIETERGWSVRADWWELG